MTRNEIRRALISVSDKTNLDVLVRNLHAADIDPPPRRAVPTWRQFLAAQAHAIIACDFLVVQTVQLRRLYVLVFIEHGTRRLHLWGARSLHSL